MREQQKDRTPKRERERENQTINREQQNERRRETENKKREREREREHMYRAVVFWSSSQVAPIFAACELGMKIPENYRDKDNLMPLYLYRPQSRTLWQERPITSI